MSITTGWTSCACTAEAARSADAKAEQINLAAVRDNVLMRIVQIFLVPVRHDFGLFPKVSPKKRLIFFPGCCVRRKAIGRVSVSGHLGLFLWLQAKTRGVRRKSFKKVHRNDRAILTIQRLRISGTGQNLQAADNRPVLVRASLGASGGRFGPAQCGALARHLLNFAGASGPAEKQRCRRHEKSFVPAKLFPTINRGFVCPKRRNTT
ncbi:hypothetical protein QKW60_10715 [Defluviimonas aestuarii]|uniref:hypothetical protein n=1 Tax=Albidovulum aestuarii TaxID=1130726 RepID=UPI00249BDDFF|nr:hypothetical protein [Defluviimonas aestuarii]MDI3336882.1 hypothetical protein [Defluviimonas aestuarii]